MSFQIVVLGSIVPDEVNLQFRAGTGGLHSAEN